MMEGVGEAPGQAAASLPPLVQGLLRPQAYSHPVDRISLIETHISWIVLTGRYAYKLKKPLKLHFLDYSTLVRRRRACYDELRLNQRLAPELYLEAVRITGSLHAPRVGGAGPTLEYAVRMHEFPQAAQADRLLAAGGLRGEALERLALRIAAFHRQAARAGSGDKFGAPAWVHAPVRETIADLLAGAGNHGPRAALLALRDWCEVRYKALAPILLSRKRAGFVREGHGDLHLANLVELHGALVPFDCIEFNADLRWGDTMADVAFLAMDLCYRRRPDLAYRFLNAYLEAGGDYAGMRLYRYYFVYRALVRAKVEMLRRDGAAGTQRRAHAAAMLKHIELARAAAERNQAALILMHGFSASGKTHLGGALAPRLPAVRIRSDVERKRLHGFSWQAQTGSPVAGGIYASAATRRTYTHLAQLAEAVLLGGEKVLVDAAFLRRVQRRRFELLARRLCVPLAIVDCRVPLAELHRRLQLRAAQAHDASEADRKVLDYQLSHHDPLGAAERALTMTVDTGRPVDADAIARRWLARLPNHNHPAAASAA